MRILPVAAVCVALLAPSAAFAACDQAEIEKLTTELTQAALAWNQKNASDSDAIMKKAQEVTKLAQDGQAKYGTSEDAACKLIKDAIDAYK